MMRKLVWLSVAMLMPTLASAQSPSLGTFRWQLLPFCNTVTLTVTAVVGGFRIEGRDDQCGSGTPASAIGTAFFNGDGSVGLGLNIVTAPRGENVHVMARVDLGTLNGTWLDSEANGGAFIFRTGPASGGQPRPRPTGIRPGTITAAHIAPGAVTAAHLTPGTVTAAHLAPGVVGLGQIDAGQVQARVTGVCPVGEYVRGIVANGRVVCGVLAMPNVSRFVDGPGEERVGFASAIAEGADGLPLIAYRNTTQFALRVLHCGNPSCTAGNVIIDADDPGIGVVGTSPSIAIGRDGLAIIAHSASNGLRVTHCGNVTCSQNNVSTGVDNPAGSIAGGTPSIAIGADGLPVISHGDQTRDTLLVTHCGNVSCSAGNVTTTADGPAGLSVGLSSSIAIGVDGLPVVSHRDATAQGLRVTHCGNMGCTAGNVSTTVNDLPNNDIGFSTSLAIGVDGLPLIAHRDVTAGALRVTHCANVACTLADVNTAADDPANGVGFSPSLAIGVDGLPIIAHADTTALVLRVTHCGNTTCTGGNVHTTVDAPGERVGEGAAILIGRDGLPVISHVAPVVGAVRVTTCGSRTCQ